MLAAACEHATGQEASEALLPIATPNLTCEDTHRYSRLDTEALGLSMVETAATAADFIPAILERLERLERGLDDVMTWVQQASTQKVRLQVNEDRFRFTDHLCAGLAGEGARVPPKAPPLADGRLQQLWHLHAKGAHPQGHRSCGPHPVPPGFLQVTRPCIRAAGTIPKAEPRLFHVIPAGEIPREVRYWTRSRTSRACGRGTPPWPTTPCGSSARRPRR
jgi:hypothetical protein